MNYISYKEIISVRLYQPDIEVPCYIIGYFPLFYLKLCPDNALGIEFVQYVSSCMRTWREMHTETLSVRVCVYTRRTYTTYTVHVCVHTVRFSRNSQGSSVIWQLPAGSHGVI